MASTAGIPEQPPDAEARTLETEPLLGRPGDATQKPDAPIIANIWLGEFPAAKATGISGAD
jgi:hypothetical protein